MISRNTYQRKDGRWESRVYTNCNKSTKRKYRSFYGKTKEAAEAKAASYLQELCEVSATEMTVGQLAAEYLSVKTPQLKESTAANYRMKVEKHIIPALGKLTVCSVKAKNIYAFIETMRRSGLSERYISDNVILIKALFRFAYNTYSIMVNLSGIIMPKRARPEVRLLSDKEQDKLKAYIDNSKDRTALGVALSLFTGIRIGELCALQWKDIDLEKRILTVSKTIQRIQTDDPAFRTKLVITEPKSRSSARSIPIPEFLALRLNRYVGTGDTYLLSGIAKPVEPRVMQYRFSQMLKNADLPSVHFHSLRHAFATKCISLGFDVKTLSEILGHSSVELTLNRYVHSSLDRKKACMDKLTWAA